MARVWIAVVPGPKKLPYGIMGRRQHRGLKRSIVDFGKRGVYRVPNHWLSESKPDAEDGRIMAEVLGIARQTAAEMGIRFFGDQAQGR